MTLEPQETRLQEMPELPSNLRVAIVHEWFVDYAGSERVVEQMLHLFPHADLFAVVDFLPPDRREFLQHKAVTTTFIQRLPGAQRHFRQYLPFMPLAIEQLDVTGYDLILSSNHAVAKGVIAGPDSLHVCYVHSPLRYAWDLQHQYLRASGLDRGLKGWVTRWMLHQLRQWDARSANGVDVFLANSRYIARRIAKAYRRPAQVIYPPVAVERFPLSDRDREDFYFTASRFVPYKRVEAIVAAFARLPDRRLVVAGDGVGAKALRAIAPPNVEFIGYQPPDRLRDCLQRARAFVFAAEEDFGITVAEAQACGTPAIAYGRGGATEIVRDIRHHAIAPTGICFEAQTPDCIAAAILQFEASTILPVDCHRNAQRFSTARFRREFYAAIAQAWASRHQLGNWGTACDNVEV